MNQSKNQNHFIDKVWNLFASVKLSVVVLLVLAATSVIGTIIPQNANPAMLVQKYGEPLFSVFQALDFFDMYHAWWFRLLLALLTVNIIVCSIDRLSATWKVLFPKKINFQASRFRKSGNRMEWREELPPQSLKDAYEFFLGKRFRHIETREKDDGLLIFGEKGRWTRLGVYAVHLSILLMVIGGLIGSLFGFKGYATIPEGETVQTVSLENKDQEMTLPFAIRCDEFRITHYESGMPKEYRSSLSLLNDGEVIRKADIRVNAPLSHQGINIFQSSYGRMAGKEFTLVFTEPDSGMTFEKSASMGEEVSLPAGKGTLIVQDFTSGYNFRGHNIGEAFLCRLIPADSEAPKKNILIPVSYPRFDRMRGGDYVISIKDVDYVYYTGLQVTRDPGVPVVYAGFLIIIIGCYITFFMQHQQVCLELTGRDEQTEVMLACISGKNRPGMKGATQRLARQIKNPANFQ